MINFLSKVFIKNRNDILNPQVRKAYGTLTGTVGIINNIFLFIIKFFAGVISGAISITADAFNNLSDAGSSIITLIGFRMAGKPADNDHPYGHGRIEYISGLIIAIIIIVMGIELLKSAIGKIINPEPVEFSILSVSILILSILVKLWMTVYNKNLGKKLSASAMLATAADSLNDCIATFVVLVCLFISYFTGLNIDGYAGAMVAIFVLWSGYQTAKETLQPLLGTPPDNETVERIKNIVMSQNNIEGIHDMIIHDYGPGRMIVSLHAEISNDIDIITAHDIIDNAEAEIKKQLNCEITIHMDPIATNDERTIQIKKCILNIIKQIDECLDIHDFRIYDKDNITNISFDVEAPFNLKFTNDELKEQILQKFRETNNDYNIVIEDIDRFSI